MKQKHIGYYLVAFVDLLGQQEQLRKLHRLPESGNDNELKSFKDIINSTFGAVEYMNKTVECFFEAFLSRIDLTKYDEEQKQFIKELSRTDVKFQRFSDCIAVYVSLHTKENTLPFRSIVGLIASVGLTVFQCMSEGFFIRAGIDIGLAKAVGTNEIYGPALARAYELESKIADYPRIVIGEEFESFLKHFSTIEVQDKYSQAYQKSANNCLSMITKDVDGYPIVDYIGKDLNLDVSPEMFKKYFNSCYENICYELDKHKESKNNKIALKYDRLKNYFDKSKQKPA
jgi:hypothetical protein